MLADAFLRSGKVRDLYRLGDGRLVLVASDRLSAFDVVLPTEIPDKGRVLTGLSRFWFRETAAIVPNHVLATDPAVLALAARKAVYDSGLRPADVGSLDALRGRTMICRPAVVLPIEAVVRGYLAGSGWKEYRETGAVCGVSLPAGLQEADRLPTPIFTPATKAEVGEHDQNITFDQMIDHLAGPAFGWADRDRSQALAERVRDLALRVYGYAAAIAERSGILVADTKFEFGLIGRELDPSDPGPPEERIGGTLSGAPGMSFDSHLEDHLHLIDEALTPDSSRFWDAATYAPGGPQASFDKQFVRDWLETQPWDKTDPGPALPSDVVDGTRSRYIDAYERLTRASFQRYLEEDVIAP